MKTTSTDIRDFQSRLFAQYMKNLPLPESYKYIHGNPVQPVVPLDTCQDGVFVIGAYPSARFASIAGERDVPVGDNCGPFSCERYFDGSRVRTVNSGDELEREYLTPLNLPHNQCWITDLVRVFLFKEGHIQKYRRLNCSCPARQTRSQFAELAKIGMPWLEEEIALARPRLIITLGAEVAGVLRQVDGASDRNALLDGRVRDLRVGALVCPTVHLAHPGIVMRVGTATNPWPELHRDKHVPCVRAILKSLKIHS